MRMTEMIMIKVVIEKRATRAIFLRILIRTFHNRVIGRIMTKQLGLALYFVSREEHLT